MYGNTVIAFVVYDFHTHADALLVAGCCHILLSRCAQQAHARCAHILCHIRYTHTRSVSRIPLPHRFLRFSAGPNSHHHSHHWHRLLSCYTMWAVPKAAPSMTLHPLRAFRCTHTRALLRLSRTLTRCRHTRTLSIRLLSHKRVLPSACAAVLLTNGSSTSHTLLLGSCFALCRSTAGSPLPHRRTGWR